jgi:hypothetical protein
MDFIRRQFEQFELKSKLADGLLPALGMSILVVVLTLLVAPLEQLTGRAGLLVLALVLMAGSGYSLDRATVNRYSDVRRAWFGIYGGMLAWKVTAVSGRIGEIDFSSQAVVIILIMLWLLGSVLWRRGVLPLGVRFFLSTYLLNGLAVVLVLAQVGAAKWSPVFAVTLSVSGYLAVAAGAISLWWLLFGSRSPQQRMLSALIFWLSLTLSLYVFWGQFI